VIFADRPDPYADWGRPEEAEKYRAQLEIVTE
jgi:hypothetical protein